MAVEAAAAVRTMAQRAALAETTGVVLVGATMERHIDTGMMLAQLSLELQIVAAVAVARPAKVMPILTIIVIMSPCPERLVAAVS